MDVLLTAIVLWLSANFGLPAGNDHPRVQFASDAKLDAMRYKGLLSHQPNPSRGSGRTGKPEMMSLYHAADKTIYLRQGWTGKTPAELSILVHEMVHHLQYLDGQKFACPAEQEKVAYQAQERWLNMFKRSLRSEFGIDDLTLKLMTQCLY